MKTSSFSIAILVLVSALHAQAQDALRPTDVGAEQVGESVAVEGRVYTVAKTDAGMHLYFGADTSTAFQAIVPSSALHEFRVDIQKRYGRRNVRVTGKVEQESGKFFVRVTKTSQLKVVPRKRGTS